MVNDDTQPTAVPQDEFDKIMAMTKPCKLCYGTGRLGKKKCGKCNGVGRVLKLTVDELRLKKFRLERKAR